MEADSANSRESERSMAAESVDKDADVSFIEGFLKDLDLTAYLGDFIDYEIITLSDLKYVDREILTEIGITKISDRVRILQKIKRFGEEKQKSQLRQLDELINKFSSLSISNSSTLNNLLSINLKNDDLITEKHHVIFILNDGSAKKVNVNGCFNAASIKKRLLKRLPREFLISERNLNSNDYDVFVADYSKNVLHLLYDVELVTICHSNDRIEKNRLIFVARDQTPSDKAITTSKKIYIKTLSYLSQMNSTSSSQPSNVISMNQQQHQTRQRQLEEERLKIENSKDKIRSIFNQRPPSELISTNLKGYFPEADFSRLQNTLRESFRQSQRLSTISHNRNINIDSNNVGDILLKRSNAVDSALLSSLDNNDKNTKRKQSNESESDHEATREEEVDEYDDSEVISLPTKMVTPKSWLKGARIGSGSFGSVYLGMNAQTGELMAVKQVAIQAQAPIPVSPTSPSKPNVEKDMKSPSSENKANSDIHRKMIDALQHEMNLLKELHHENIVTYYGSSQEGGNLNIFLEYVPGGSVSSMLNSYGPFEESLIINFTRQILIGVSYLHKKNIIHRDIKGANILIDIKGCVKITDFGISKKLSPLNNTSGDDGSGESDKRASLQGSVYWMAPEVVKQTATTSKVDIWSTACVVIEMFTGKHPFPDFSQMQAIFKIGTNTMPEVPSWSSDDARDFLKESFILDYRQRPSAIQLLQHKWLDTSIL
ncbi:hypothetical protein KAFR_0A06190 [Kazachstania africana CBS 2517]|uniref:Serine/threonine-protein kinase STE11 n=1 Tax=Kazachstania africana (strain ATCC 22294 / BCRC 22015 / CBS 2517 / CECT 1963 / NBRC 1671 / NRRL Y-8276) TaxID=1071382 RepID=H2ANV4_KAZAF|nr:hypothetical protein KAFR_0A06190 [Kazachstania africana CBS 2517]CCF56054.1 hypothetical protein KAFR_0A06190 [Kazachstania africana CBS 2517]